ncbi:NAD-dependent epimerase/dehydratase family protein [Massilia brevitalea]|uniref:NAD-dependent epimerase/dehydratase family protein n=1 Tax=Massilia brevitalea TaxID=442526 RepID=UPI0027385E6E|nr:NAD(P)-dependent oxidoreductase [Massilia brevitalea]
MIFLIGGSGRLGQAIARQHAGASVTVLPRALYAHWGEPGAHHEVAEYFAPWAGSGSVVYVTSGLLDPRLAPEEHARVNVALPLNIVEGAASLGLKVRTFGTVMETLMASQNPYVRSKAELGRRIAAASASGLPVAHVRIHTLYGGGEPASFMFLGQILSALRAQAPFRMTLGRQLREYHHVDDDAAALARLEETGLSGVVDLSHGAPLSLRALAETVFEAFGARAQLEVGALPEPASDNFGAVLERPAALELAYFRDAAAGVVDYLKPYILQPAVPTDDVH